MVETPLLSVGGVDENEESSLFNNNNDEQLTFRNKPIKWIENSEIKTRTIKSNQFGNEPEEQQYTRTEYLISYEGKEYTREEFLFAMFPDYKKYEYKVKFLYDYVFWLISSQRAKLQYDILAQYFPLVEVAEQDKADLERFAASGSKGNSTAQEWYNRMQWHKGHEKMITFGAAIDVRAAQGTTALKGLFCYASEIIRGKARYQGVCMNWEVWSAEIKRQLDNGRKLLSGRTDKRQRQAIIDEIQENANKALYYQDGFYLTVPKAEIDKIQLWIYKYLKDGKAQFPFCGEIPNADVSFTIDFKRDVEIVRVFDGVRESNKQRGKNISKNNADQLPEGELSRQEVINLCGSKGKFDRMVKNGNIVHVEGKRGYYQRKQE